jgi:hypothetical protein
MGFAMLYPSNSEEQWMTENDKGGLANPVPHFGKE